MSQSSSSLGTFTKGLWKENPTFRLLLGFCPTLAVTTSAKDGIGMGVSTLVVLLGSNIVISLLNRWIPDKVRIPAFIVVIATFVTIVDLSLQAWAFELHKSLGIFIPLIVVNCIILGRAEAFASKNGVWASILDALGMGLGFTLGLTVLGLIREILGSGSAFGYSIVDGNPFLLMVLPPGAFITLGLLLALMNWYDSRKEAAK